MDRVVIFTQSADWMANILLRSTLEALGSQSELKLVAVCLPHKPNNWRMSYRYIRDSITRKIKTIFDPQVKKRPKLPLPVYVDRWSKKLDFKIIIPPRGNINHPEFLDQLRADIKPTVAIAYMCLQKFSPELLSIFNYSFNYHNGLLPNYKGIRATAWSVYCGEEKTGFTFHLMNEKLDEGAILLQGAMPIRIDDRTIDLDIVKAQQAAASVPQIIDMVLDRFPGKPQEKEGSYFSRKDAREIQRISNTSNISSVEILLRLKAFGSLNIFIEGQWYAATKVRPVSDQTDTRHYLYFQTSDGILFNITWVDYLPFHVYRVRERVKKILQ